MGAMLLNYNEEAIIAQCTPTGSGSIALLRISGINSIAIISKISKLASKKKLINAATHTINYGWIVDNNSNHIDQVLFLLMRAPYTFTGQDTVEITCHNNPFIIEQIIQQTINNGARPAREGEFSKRAVLNKKIDLVQAEAINDLIHANSQLALKKSLAQLEGSFSHWITHIEENLLKALALSQASFEFIDEENMEFAEQIKGIINNIQKTITNIKSTFEQQQQIRQGIRIAIIGSVNAGKSSLFNLLLKENRAIVTNIAGTTRDTIEAGSYKEGNYWTLIDTAGLRQAAHVIEQAGIKRSFDEAHSADIILLVFDNSRKITKKEDAIYKKIITKYKTKIIIIRNKVDLPPEKISFPSLIESINISTKENINIHLVEQAIEKKIKLLFKAVDSPFLLNKRQFNLLLHFEKNLIVLKAMLHDNIQYELVSYHLTDALSHLSELTGKSINEASMNAIFREFCIGK
jgi:tRNA modification GTPase